ncbi:hypothetical protein ACWEQL_00560 [Kitasatospora sp. NPDC004240]
MSNSDAAKARIAHAARALSDFHGGPIAPPEIPAVLTAFLAEMVHLADFMQSDFSLILARGYLYSTGGRALPDWPEGERPLTELAEAPQKKVARALGVFIDEGGAAGTPPCFAASMAKLFACLVDFADHQLAAHDDATFESCLPAAWKGQA